MSFIIKVKNNTNSALPRKGEPLSSGFDIFARSEPTIIGEEIQPGIWRRIDYIEYNTGIQMEPVDYIHALIHPRSSISKYNLILANSVGLVDTSYRNFILLRFKYFAQPENYVFLDPTKHPSFGIQIDESKIYHTGDAIGQLVFEPVFNDIQFELVEELNKTERTGGFGSTGK